MTARNRIDRSVRTIVVIVLALVACAFGVIQLASDSLYAQAAAPGSLPTRVPAAFGLAVYEALDRVAPAPYVEATLARAALQRGDTASAERYAVHLPPTPVRDGLLEQIAAAQHQPVLAFEYAFAAPDIAAVQNTITAMRARNPKEAYQLEERFILRLTQLHTHPDAVARGWWILGTIAAQISDDSWQRLAYRDYVTAATLAPLDLTNVLGAANEAVTLRDWSSAARWYEEALTVNPATADAVAGLGVVALNQAHDRASAERRLRQAFAIDPNSALALELQRELKDHR